MAKKGKGKQRKGGRKPMQGAREPNGRLSRKRTHVQEREVMSAKEAQSVVVQARMRLFGLSEEAAARNVAGRPNAGTLHGIMCLRGDISRAQWDAAEWYLGKRAAWLRAIETPNQETGPAPGGEFNEDRHEAFCKRAREDWAAIAGCVQDASTETRSPLMSALDVVLARQQYVSHMVGDLRLVLNAIHRRFLSAERKAA
jgi:hypothetical protein